MSPDPTRSDSRSPASPASGSCSREQRTAESPGARARAAHWIADRLDVRLSQRRLGGPQLVGLVGALSALHESPPPAPAAAGAAASDAATRAAAARAAIAAAAPALATAALGCEATVRAHAPTLAEREAVRGARRLHGALRCDAIHVDPEGAATLGPAAAGAAGDPLEDVAALAVELVARGHAGAAGQLVAAWAAGTGDFALYRALDAHLSLAALAAARRALEAGADGAHAVAQGLLAAPGALAPAAGKAVLLAVAGGVASGKSTLAARLAAATGAPVASADAARPDGVHALAPDAGDEAYTGMLQHADDVLASGRPVIADACFATRAQRARLRALAERHGVPLLVVECRADAATVRRRLRARAQRQGCAEADWLALRDRVAAAWEPMRELRREQHLAVDAARELDAELPRVARALERAASGPHRVRRAGPPGASAFA